MEGGLIYFFPGAGPTLSPADLEARGLGYAFDRAPDCRQTGRGPDGGPGLLCSGQLGGAALSYEASSQRWIEIPGAKAPAWVGIWRDSPPPGPADLARPVQLPGHRVELADGREWVAPIVRGVAEDGGEPIAYCPLPREMQLDEEGRLSPGEITKAYQTLWDAAAAFFDTVAGPLEDPAGDAETRIPIDSNAAVELLAANYFLGPAEVVLLGLLRWNGPEAQRILEAAIDLPSWEQLLKKKRPPDTSSIGNGPPGGPGDTDPP